MDPCAFVNMLNQTGVEEITPTYHLMDTAMWQCTLNRGAGMTPVVACAAKKVQAYQDACKLMKEKHNPIFSDGDSDGGSSPITFTPTANDVISWFPSSTKPLQFKPIVTDDMNEHTRNMFVCGMMYGCMITASKETTCEFLATNTMEEMSARNLMNACEAMAVTEEGDAVV